jgi:hypothetical protein
MPAETDLVQVVTNAAQGQGLQMTRRDAQAYVKANPDATIQEISAPVDTAEAEAAQADAEEKAMSRPPENKQRAKSEDKGR